MDAGQQTLRHLLALVTAIHLVVDLVPRHVVDEHLLGLLVVRHEARKRRTEVAPDRFDGEPGLGRGILEREVVEPDHVAMGGRDEVQEQSFLLEREGAFDVRVGPEGRHDLPV